MGRAVEAGLHQHHGGEFAPAAHFCSVGSPVLNRAPCLRMAQMGWSVGKVVGGA